MAGVPAADAAREDSPWSWVDRGPKLLDVSCSAPGQCVGVGVQGAVLRSVPGGGSLEWSGVKLPRPAGDDPPQALVAVTCSGSHCLAASGGDGTTNGVSLVYRSEDSGATWAPGVELPAAPGSKTKVAADVACDPSGTCVAAGPAGGIWRSRDDGSSWSALSASSLAIPYRRLACPASGVCVLVGSKTTSVVLKDGNADKVAMPAGAGTVAALACESESTCTATDKLSQAMAISAPWRRWEAPDLLPGAVSAGSLACPARDTCVGINGPGPGEGGAVRTTSRSSGTWAKRPTGTKALLALDCAGQQCTAVGNSASWYESADAGLSWGQVNAVAKFNGVDCPGGGGTGTCMAGGLSDIGKSITAGGLWRTPLGNVSGLDVDAVSCAGFPECIALGKDRTLATVDAGASWVNRLAAGTVAAGPGAEACVAADQCFGVGGGAIFSTLDGARTGWFLGAIPAVPMEMLKAIACPTPTVCVVAGSETIYRGQLTVTDGKPEWSWMASDADPSDPLNGIDCASPASCTAVGFKGQVLTSSDPALLHWQRQQIGSGPDAKRPPLLSVKCPSQGVCVAGGERGFLATTTSNWAAWSLQQLGAGPDRPSIKGFGCVTPSRCVAVGDTVLTGTRGAG